LEWVAIKCAAQNRVVSGTVHRRPDGERHLASAIQTFKQPRPAFSATARRLPQEGQTKPSGQRRLDKNGATRLVGELSLQGELVCGLHILALKLRT
jgi:hypothetical protein